MEKVPYCVKLSLLYCGTTLGIVLKNLKTSILLNRKFFFEMQIQFFEIFYGKSTILRINNKFNIKFTTKQIIFLRSLEIAF